MTSPKTPSSALRYRGQGQFFVGVPATDLTADEIARLAGSEDPAKFRARLLASGLYAPAQPPQKELSHV